MGRSDAESVDMGNTESGSVSEMSFCAPSSSQPLLSEVRITIQMVLSVTPCASVRIAIHCPVCNFWAYRIIKDVLSSLPNYGY